MPLKRRRQSDTFDEEEDGSDSDNEPPLPGSSSAIPPAPAPTRITRQQITPLLKCTLCINPNDPLQQCLFNSPVTLPCGHSFCASHLAALLASSSSATPRPAGLVCPVAGCTSLTLRPSHAPPSLHPSSSVACYIPHMKPRSDHAPLILLEDAKALKPDIGLARLLDLFAAAPSLPGQDDVDSEANMSPSLSPSDEEGHPPELRKPKRRRLFRGSPNSQQLAFVKSLRDILTCEVCFMLYHEPITLQCGHTFCAKCLQRTLDQHSRCPLCRAPLPGDVCAILHMLDVREKEPPTNKVLTGIIMLVFIKEHMDRRQALVDEVRNAHAGGFDTPVYMCSELIFPGIRTRFTFAQPAHRLMLRRVLATPEAKFGVMLQPTVPQEGENTMQGYGTLACVKTVQLLPNNSSVAEVEGTSRFRLLETRSVDGYLIARIETVEDRPDVNISISPSASSPYIPAPPPLVTAPPEPEPIPTESPAGEIHTLISAGDQDPSTDSMMEVCRRFVEDLRTGAAPWVVQSLNDSYGSEPVDDPVAFGWWMAKLLPIPDHDKSKLLAIRSPKLRLRLICHWTTTLSDQWWYSRGCFIC